MIRFHPKTAQASTAISIASSLPVLWTINHSPLTLTFRAHTKKGALRLVQSGINLFIISIFSSNSRQKNEGKRPKIALFSALFVPFIAKFPPFLAAGMEGMRGMEQV